MHSNFNQKRDDSNTILKRTSGNQGENPLCQEVEEERDSKAEKLKLMFPITEAELWTLEGTLSAGCSLPLATRKATFKSLQIDENVLFKTEKKPLEKEIIFLSKLFPDLLCP